jgi:hypothetical protein
MLSQQTFIELQATDTFCQVVKRWLLNSDLLRHKELAVQLMMNREMYTLDEDELVMRCTVSRPKRSMMLLQWVVPMVPRPLVLRLSHDDATAGHAGIGPTLIAVPLAWHEQGRQRLRGEPCALYEAQVCAF